MNSPDAAPQKQLHRDAGTPSKRFDIISRNEFVRRKNLVNKCPQALFASRVS